MIFGDSRLPQRFWDKVMPEANTGCWLWTAATNNAGRPHFKVGGKPILAYKMTIELERGPCPEGKECSHLCDQKLCVNPDHVIYETHRENDARKRAYPEYAHLPPAEYDKATRRGRKLAARLRRKEASCD
jgi:Zinc-binding loop region of homing endonuclease